MAEHKFKHGLGLAKSVGGFDREGKQRVEITLTEELLRFLLTVHPDPSVAIEMLLANGTARNYIEVVGNPASCKLRLKGGKE